MNGEAPLLAYILLCIPVSMLIGLMWAVLRSNKEYEEKYKKSVNREPVNVGKLVGEVKIDDKYIGIEVSGVSRPSKYAYRVGGVAYVDTTAMELFTAIREKMVKRGTFKVPGDNMWVNINRVGGFKLELEDYYDHTTKANEGDEL